MHNFFQARALFTGLSPLAEALGLIGTHLDVKSEKVNTTIGKRHSSMSQKGSGKSLLPAAGLGFRILVTSVFRCLANPELESIRRAEHTQLPHWD